METCYPLQKSVQPSVIPFYFTVFLTTLTFTAQYLQDIINDSRRSIEWVLQTPKKLLGFRLRATQFGRLPFTIIKGYNDSLEIFCQTTGVLTTVYFTPGFYTNISLAIELRTKIQASAADFVTFNLTYSTTTFLHSWTAPSAGYAANVYIVRLGRTPLRWLVGERTDMTLHFATLPITTSTLLCTPGSISLPPCPIIYVCSNALTSKLGTQNASNYSNINSNANLYGENLVKPNSSIGFIEFNNGVGGSMVAYQYSAPDTAFKLFETPSVVDKIDIFYEDQHGERLPFDQVNSGQTHIIDLIPAEVYAL